MTYELESMTIRELKAIAKEHKIAGYSRMVKVDLLATIRNHFATEAESESAPPPILEAIASLEADNKQSPEPAASTGPLILGDHPGTEPATWSDLLQTAWVVVCMTITTAIWLGRKARQASQSAQAVAARAALQRLFTGTQRTSQQDSEPEPAAEPEPTAIERLQQINIARAEAGRFPLPMPQQPEPALAGLPLSDLESALEAACQRSPLGFGRFPDRIYWAAK